jgi:hypothetical protein
MGKSVYFVGHSHINVKFYCTLYDELGTVRHFVNYET